MSSIAGTTIGVVGGAWRGRVSAWGALEPGDGSPVLDWWVAADDRWHTPETEPSCRQRLIDDVPVVETAVRVPGGDAVHRVYAVADAGGLTVIELENRSPAPFAVALSRRDLVTARPPVEIPLAGPPAPANALVVPVGHRATARVALAHQPGGATVRLADLPGPAEVARGWLAQTQGAVRLVLPVSAPTVAVTALRARLLLEGPGPVRPDPMTFLVAVAELAGLGQPVEAWEDDVGVAVHELARQVRTDRRSAGLPWAVDAALAAAQEVLAHLDDPRAQRDIDALRRRLPAPRPTPLGPPDGAFGLAWAARRVVVASAGGDDVDVLPAPFPPGWLGEAVEVHGVRFGSRRLGLAVRWHGVRPALLWELDGPPARLRSSGLDAGWSTDQRRGEALLAAPAVGPAGRESATDH